MIAARDYNKFACLIEALRPGLDRLVIIGGWAHRLHRMHPLAQGIRYEPLMTRDADIAISAAGPLPQENLRDRLLSHGFREEFYGDIRPPVTKYLLGDDEFGFYVEFVTPLFGSEVKRKKRRDVTTALAGVTAQKLRYLDVLLIEPWSVPFAFPGRKSKTQPQIKVANPVTFIAQKLLVSGKRKPNERAKDVLYIHDTLELFGRSLPELGQLWVDDVAPRLGSRIKAKIQQAGRRLFEEVTDITREAALMTTGRQLSPESLLEACQAGTDLVFS